MYRMAKSDYSDPAYTYSPAEYDSLENDDKSTGEQLRVELVARGQGCFCFFRDLRDVNDYRLLFPFRSTRKAPTSKVPFLSSQRFQFDQG